MAPTAHSGSLGPLEGLQTEELTDLSCSCPACVPARTLPCPVAATQPDPLCPRAPGRVKQGAFL